MRAKRGTLDKHGNIAQPQPQPQPQPQRLGSRLTIAIPAQKAAESGNQPHHGVELWDGFGYRFLVQDVGRLPFILLKQQVRRQLGQTAPQSHQPVDPPGHHQVQRQSRLDALDVAQLQRFDAATFFQDQKEQLDLPARPVPSELIDDTP